MSSFNVGSNDVVRFCHLLTPDRWSNPMYLALVKDFWTRNMASNFKHVNLNFVIDVLPDFKILDKEIVVILEISRGNLIPHFLENRAPTAAIPNAMFVTAAASTWCDPAKLNGISMSPGPTNDPRGFDKQLIANLIFMLVHAARHMADGVTGSSDERAVIASQQSQFYRSTLAVNYLISCRGNAAGFRLPDPDVVKDIMGVPITKADVDSVVSTIFGSQSIEAFFNNYLRTVKDTGLFPPEFPLNDLLRLTAGMAKLAAMSWYDGEKYSAARDLFFAKLLDPELPAPHLTPRGKALRDLIWPLGLRLLPAFAKLPAQPMGLGMRTPISEIQQIGGNMR